MYNESRHLSLNLIGEFMKCSVWSNIVYEIHLDTD
jgi:hypothetical protein